MVKVVSEITHANNPICPCVEEVLVELFVGTAAARQVIRYGTVRKGINVLLKLNYDETHRLLGTLGTMRACRLWDYDFVANTSLPTLQEEMVHLNLLPHCISAINELTLELHACQRGAEQEPTKRRSYPGHSLLTCHECFSPKYLHRENSQHSDPSTKSVSLSKISYLWHTPNP